jgi:ABC-type Zn uptake system ZnuABC Zn-binding protein ZnuA
VKNGMGRTLGAALVLMTLLSAGLAACGASPRAEPDGGEEEHTDEADLTSIERLSPVELSEGERLRVVATTTIVGDVVAQVGQGAIDLVVLLPVGADPHGYTPTPKDLQTVADAHLVFLNGFGLEEALQETLDQAGGAMLVSISEGIEPLSFEAGADEQGEDEGDAHHHPVGVDPHVWFDPTNVMIWAGNAARALGALDPANATFYQANADAYIDELEALDGWIEVQVEAVPPSNRVLVTDHAVFNPFAGRYGFEVVGTVIPAYSSNASVSAKELAELIETIETTGAPAVFVGLTVNPEVAEGVAVDTGVQVVPLYTGSLSEVGGPADSYIAMMRYDVAAIVEGLK